MVGVGIGAGDGGPLLKIPTISCLGLIHKFLYLQNEKSKKLTVIDRSRQAC